MVSRAEVMDKCADELQSLYRYVRPSIVNICSGTICHSRLEFPHMILCHTSDSMDVSRCGVP